MDRRGTEQDNRVKAQGSNRRVTDGIANDAFHADRLAQRWYAGEPVRPEDSVSAAIARFNPAEVPPAQWARIGPVVRASVEKAAPTSVYSARTLMSVTTQLAIWADILGQPLDPEVLFHPQLIDRFITDSSLDLGDGTRLNYRRHLNDVGTAVVGPPLYPPKRIALQRPDPLAPFSAKQITALWAWCHGLPTGHFRDNAKAVVSIGRGAGLTSQEMSKAIGDDVVVDADGVVVNVIGHKARVVPVLDTWADVVLARAVEVGPRPFLLPERTRISRSQLSNFLEKCPTGDAPQLDTRRLRNTWIVGQLSAGTDIQTLADAAGVSPSQIVKYRKFADRPEPAEARRQLRQGDG